MTASALHLELVFSRPETTLSVTRGAARLMLDLGYAPLAEVTLPNGRRADVMALGPRGDIVICVPVLQREAKEQHKKFLAHAAHLTLHGTLHALGYDHLKAREAKHMESLEIKILAQIGTHDPYLLP